jgi:hypothetical protein
LNVVLIEKSSKAIKLSLYNESLSLIDSESFDDLNSMNFHLQALAKKHNIERGLIVIHDRDRNTVTLSIVQDENSFFVC